MKQLRFLLSSPSSKVNTVGMAKMDNGVKKSDPKIKTYKFPFVMKSTSSSYHKWFMASYSHEGDVKWIQHATREDASSNSCFHEAIGSILALAQCFGMMPVVGIKSKSATDLRFRWRSFRTIYSFILFVFMMIYSGMTLWVTLSKKISFDRIIAFIFYGSGVYGMLCFGILAREWPQLLQRWEAVEAKLPKFRTKQEKQGMAFHIKMLAFVVLMCSLIEHVLYMFSISYYSKRCSLSQEEPVKQLLVASQSELFAIIEFLYWSAFLGKIVNIVATFTWNYMDLFVMMISLGISSGFKQINDDLQRIKGQQMSEEFWAMRRLQYRLLAELCVLIDGAISKITFVSFANNLFFISKQLLWSIRPMLSIPHAIYFWFSLIFLIARTLAVSLYSAGIYDQSKKPIEVLRAVPTNSWCSEAKRFSEQVVNDTIALTGMRFYFITRKLILTITGTIITYELVLLQFQTDEYSQLCV